MPESVREVLSRIIEVRPPHEAGRTAREPRDVGPGSALVPLGTLAKRNSEETNDQPLFTAAELRRMTEYVKSFADGCVLLPELERMILRPGLSEADAKQVVKLMHQTVAMIEPLRPIIDALNTFCAKQEKLALQCRECIDSLNNWEVNLKLDRLQSTLDRFVDSIDPKIQEQLAKRPISTLAELCERLVEKN